MMLMLGNAGGAAGSEFGDPIEFGGGESVPIWRYAAAIIVLLCLFVALPIGLLHWLGMI
jgi:hypothetical protein